MIEKDTIIELWREIVSLNGSQETTMLNLTTEQDLAKRLRELGIDADTWLDEPNERLASKKPRELFRGTKDERELVEELVSIIERGTFA
jgi:hypothetical protein